MSFQFTEFKADDLLPVIESDVTAHLCTPDQTGISTGACQFILGMIADRIVNSSPHDIGKQVWTWIAGSRKANHGTGPFSGFIGDDAGSQHQARYRTSMTEGQLQGAPIGVATDSLIETPGKLNSRGELKSLTLARRPIPNSGEFTR